MNRVDTIDPIDVLYSDYILDSLPSLYYIAYDIYSPLYYVRDQH